MALYEAQIRMHVVFDCDPRDAIQKMRDLEQKAIHGVPGYVVSHSSNFTGLPSRFAEDYEDQPTQLMDTIDDATGQGRR